MGIEKIIGICLIGTTIFGSGCRTLERESIFMQNEKRGEEYSDQGQKHVDGDTKNNFYLVDENEVANDYAYKYDSEESSIAEQISKLIDSMTPEIADEEIKKVKEEISALCSENVYLATRVFGIKENNYDFDVKYRDFDIGGISGVRGTARAIRYSSKGEEKKLLQIRVYDRRDRKERIIYDGYTEDLKYTTGILDGNADSIKILTDNGRYVELREDVFFEAKYGTNMADFLKAIIESWTDESLDLKVKVDNK